MTEQLSAPPMTPQPYPLWCTAVSAEETEVSCGRIVGWLPAGPTDEGREQVPVVADEDEYGQAETIVTALNDDVLFITDTRDEGLRRAQRWINRERRFQFETTSTAWDTNRDTVLAEAHAQADKHGLALPGQPEVTAYRTANGTAVQLAWPKAHPNRRWRVTASAQVVEDDAAADTGHHPQ
ncbi:MULTISPECIES: hypothetical protein [unclassified Micromonospora]|uniref:hypothetical protein n=1 Tax=unclassified Micromonospora TaxID=2617518 RepID=UPI0033254A4C